MRKLAVDNPKVLPVKLSRGKVVSYKTVDAKVNYYIAKCWTARSMKETNSGDQHSGRPIEFDVNTVEGLIQANAKAMKRELAELLS